MAALSSAMPLFHFSEEPDIARFEPRSPLARPEIQPFVWAIDAWHARMYYFPRECPRACFWPGEKTSTEDRERWFGGVQAEMVIAVESGWLDRIRQTTLYRYTLANDAFVQNDSTAGHYVSRVPVLPVSVEPVGDLLEALVAADVELRITPTLLDLWRRIITSTMEFSGTRLRNAHDWNDWAS